MPAKAGILRLYQYAFRWIRLIYRCPNYFKIYTLKNSKY